MDRARLANEPTLITRYGKPAAVVVSADWYQVSGDVCRILEPGDHGYEHKPAGTIDGPSGGVMIVETKQGARAVRRLLLRGGGSGI